MTCIAAVRKTDMTNEDMLRHDLEFHNIIRRAANNDILLNICITLTGTIYDERRVLFTHTNYVEQSLWEHNQIAHAFRFATSIRSSRRTSPTLPRPVRASN